MSRFTGRQDMTGPLKGRPNKGVMAGYRATKRAEAEARNLESSPRRWKCGHVATSPDHPCRAKERDIDEHLAGQHWDEGQRHAKESAAEREAVTAS